MQDQKLTATQRDWIKNQQAVLLKEMSIEQASVVRRFALKPYLSLEVNAESLLCLFESPKVESIEEVRIFPPLLSDSTKVIGAVEAWGWGFRGG